MIYLILYTYTYFEKPTFSFLIPDDKMSKYLHNTNDLIASRLRILILSIFVYNSLFKYKILMLDPGRSISTR